MFAPIQRTSESEERPMRIVYAVATSRHDIAHQREQGAGSSRDRIITP